MIAVLAGCIAAVADPAPVEAVVPCPDPRTNCTQSNGTGVYFEEGGHAGIGPMKLMITTFINNGGSVSVKGRYQDTKSTLWHSLAKPGIITSADYWGRTGLRVTAVSEKDTVPTWTLVDATNRITLVTGSQLVRLKLHVTVLIAQEDKQGKVQNKVDIVLDFGTIRESAGYLDSGIRLIRPERVIPVIPVIPLRDHTIVRPRQPAQKYNMRWRYETDLSTAATEYCLSAIGRPDRVVFQQGIYVDPVTGHVTRANTTDHVTISCYLGAMATAYEWGYPHQGRSDTDTFYFDAAIHMKRASYCGDWQYYTRAGTPIRIADDRGLQTGPSTPFLEAWWGPEGARCLTTRRQPHVRAFTGCLGRMLPLCPPGAPPPPFLLNYAVSIPTP